MKLKDINTARIDALFNKLHQCGATTERYILTDESVVANGTRGPIFRKSGVTMETMRRMAEGTLVTRDTAVKICEATGRRLGDCFRKVQENHGLTEGTVKRIRTALSPIFSTAVKKGPLHCPGGEQRIKLQRQGDGLLPYDLLEEHINRTADRKSELVKT